jgi:hypothetical protein
LLQSVLANYLDSIKREKDFYPPFIALLATMGFSDICLLHGTTEFGKDIIAKRQIEDKTIQYVFQIKKGNIGQAEWREIQPQVLDAALNTLSHPNFDKSLDRQVVLVTTGNLTGNAPLATQEFNRVLAEKYQLPGIQYWEKQTLIKFFMEYGFEGIHEATSIGFYGYGKFFEIYGRALRRQATVSDLEDHSRYWMAATGDTATCLLIATTEASILIEVFHERDEPYLALICGLSVLRAVLIAIFRGIRRPDPFVAVLHREVLASISDLCDVCIRFYEERWKATGERMVDAIGGLGLIVAYPIHCARFVETIGLRFFLASHGSERAASVALLERFILKEQGCSHPISDKYTVSIAAATLALVAGGRTDVARVLASNSMVWVSNRYVDGVGLASVDDSPDEEIATLLFFPFEGVKIDRRSHSLLVTMLADLAARFAPSLYKDVVNDIQACKIVPSYFQPVDTEGQFNIDGDDVIQYPNVEFDAEVDVVDGLSYAEHIRAECRSFNVADVVGPPSYLALGLLLRDRYFPTLWPALLAGATSTV